MKKVSLSEAPKVAFNFEGYIMHASNNLEVIHLYLHPGQEIEQHANPFDVVISLIEGEVTLNCGNDHTRLKLYDVVEIEKGILRGFTNKGTKEARLLVLKKL
jgi:quercetin dioxygenase-like cupin family protein